MSLLSLKVFLLLNFCSDGGTSFSEGVGEVVETNNIICISWFVTY